MYLSRSLPRVSFGALVTNGMYLKKCLDVEVNVAQFGISNKYLG